MVGLLFNLASTRQIIGGTLNGPQFFRRDDPFACQPSQTSTSTRSQISSLFSSDHTRANSGRVYRSIMRSPPWGGSTAKTADAVASPHDYRTA